MCKRAYTKFSPFSHFTLTSPVNGTHFFFFYFQHLKLTQHLDVLDGQRMDSPFNFMVIWLRPLFPVF